LSVSLWLNRFRSTCWTNDFVNINKSYGKVKVEYRTGRTRCLSNHTHTFSQTQPGEERGERERERERMSHSFVSRFIRTIYEDSVFAKVLLHFTFVHTLSLRLSYKHFYRYYQMLRDSNLMEERDYRTYIELFNNMANFMRKPNLVCIIYFFTLTRTHSFWIFVETFEKSDSITLCRSYIWTSLRKKV
jgi:hypothetical protein